MLVQARTTRRLAWLLATMASNASWDISALVAHIPEMLVGRHPDHPPRLARREDDPRVTFRSQGQVAVVCLIPAIPVCCGSSTSHWVGKSYGSCRWHFWECSLLPGSVVHVSGRIDRNNH